MTWLEEYWLEVVGWIGSALLIVSLLQTRVLRFRILNLAASLPRRTPPRPSELRHPDSDPGMLSLPLWTIAERAGP